MWASSPQIVRGEARTSSAAVAREKMQIYPDHVVATQHYTTNTSMTNFLD
jgi:hypothetical protein